MRFEVLEGRTGWTAGFPEAEPGQGPSQASERHGCLDGPLYALPEFHHGVWTLEEGRSPSSASTWEGQLRGLRVAGAAGRGLSARVAGRPSRVLHSEPGLPFRSCPPWPGGPGAAGRGISS